MLMNMPWTYALPFFFLTTLRSFEKALLMDILQGIARKQNKSEAVDSRQERKELTKSNKAASLHRRKLILSAEAKQPSISDRLSKCLISSHVERTHL